jgi:ATP-dependent exoDNAse (exonuclease V) beta subunit
MLHPVLSKRNQHPRDLNIVFQEEGHKYTILTDPDSTYTSVTTWNHSHFEHFNVDKVIQNMMQGKAWKEGHKYWPLTAEQIKEQWNQNGKQVSQLGTDMHYQIECFMNEPCFHDKRVYNHRDLWDHVQKGTTATENATENEKTKEWGHFLQYIQDTPDFTPYRTEWTIYHEELKLAGSIDMVYENPEDGTLAIYDWKRSKDITKINTFNRFALTQCISHLPDANFWHYTLQLNTYKAILEEKYDKKVTHLCLVRLHPDEESYELLNVPMVTEEIKELFALRKKTI